MSKVLTDQIEKRTGGTAIDVPSTGKWPTANIADDAVTATQIAADAVGSSEIAANAVTASEIAASTITPAQMAGSAFLAHRNVIINGGMDISQRYGTSSTAISVATNVYGIDRWKIYYATGSGHTVQQVADAPVGSGLTYSLKTTIGTGAVPTAAQQSIVNQRVEGSNWTRFSFGTASPATISLSFWVKSSLTGTFGFAFKSTNVDLHYVASYTISAANTWEKKTIEGIVGPTTGTWTGGNGIGCFVNWDLGSGTDFKKAAGAWTAGNADGVTGGTNLVATSGATWQITGVQIEESATATPFEHKGIQAETSNCKRYYDKESTTTPFQGFVESGDDYGGNVFFTTEMRAAPTVTQTHVTSHKFPGTAPGTSEIQTGKFFSYKTADGSSSGSTSGYYRMSWTADAEL